MKSYRIIDGYVWLWESDGEYLRLIKFTESKGMEDIEVYAERLIENIKRNSKQIVYNLK